MAQEPQNTDSILDFLYVDFNRIKSWIAQLVDDGVQTSHKKLTNSSESSNDEVGGFVESGARASVLVAKAGLKASANAKSSSSESYASTLEKSFDASWSLPLNFLDLVSEAGLINPSIESASIGSLVLVTGSPVVMDIKFLQDIWAPGIAYMASQSKVTHKTKHAHSEMTNLGSFLKVMPPAPQMKIYVENGPTAWATLNNEHMIINTSALALTHGFNISGQWGVLAILDATPDIGMPAPPVRSSSGLLGGMNDLLVSLRDTMGRPADAYGISPLVIYREVERLKA